LAQFLTQVIFFTIIETLEKKNISSKKFTAYDISTYRIVHKFNILLIILFTFLLMPTTPILLAKTKIKTKPKINKIKISLIKG
jgi:hypothetical protein